ncbi:MAG: hypothetical protein ACRCXX_10195 [Cetobacterium sp.]|uniref:hypothetical protein n=1 Tax=Cetobacterium sp. TaxID=2071632 RepID=UPI003F2DAD4A
MEEFGDIDEIMTSQNVRNTHDIQILNESDREMLMFPTIDWQYKDDYLIIECDPDTFVSKFSQTHVLETILHITAMLYRGEHSAYISNQLVTELLLGRGVSEEKNGKAIQYTARSTDHRLITFINCSISDSESENEIILWIRTYYWLRCVKETYYCFVYEYLNTLDAQKDNNAIADFLSLKSIAIMLMLHPLALRFWNFVKKAELSFNGNIDDYIDDILPQMGLKYKHLLDTHISRLFVDEEKLTVESNNFLSSILDAERLRFWKAAYKCDTCQFKGPLKCITAIFDEFKKKTSTSEISRRGRKTSKNCKTGSTGRYATGVTGRGRLRM